MIFRQSTVDDAAIENWDIEDNVLSRGEMGYEGISRVILPPNTDYTIFALYADSLMFGSTLWTELSPTGTNRLTIDIIHERFGMRATQRFMFITL